MFKITFTEVYQKSYSEYSTFCDTNRVPPRWQHCRFSFRVIIFGGKTGREMKKKIFPSVTLSGGRHSYKLYILVRNFVLKHENCDI